MGNVILFLWSSSCCLTVFLDDFGNSCACLFFSSENSDKSPTLEERHVNKLDQSKTRIPFACRFSWAMSVTRPCQWLSDLRGFWSRDMHCICCIKYFFVKGGRYLTFICNCKYKHSPTDLRFETVSCLVQQLLITSAHGGITYVDLLKATFYHDAVLGACL